jgi:putative acetyltransferase
MNGAISPDDPRADDVQQMLAAHLAFCNEHSPPEDVHALDLDGLADPSVTFYSYRQHGRLMGVGAIKWLDDDHAELKSMHTDRVARRQGVARAMVDHLVEVARARGFRRVSLETGTMDVFAPARSLYAGAGFVPCGPFASYTPSPNSTYMTLSLTGDA